MTRWVLGLGFSHDASGYLLADGEPVVGIQLERLTRVKHDDRLAEASRLIAYLTSAAGVSVDALDGIGVSAPYLRSSEQVKSSPVDLLADNVLHVGHHLAHAYSAFGPSGLAHAAVLVVDGHGDAYYESTCDQLESGPAVARRIEKSDAGIADTTVAPRFECESIYRFDRHGYALLYRNYLRFGRRISSTFGWGDTLGIGMNYADVATWLFGSRHASGKVMGLAPLAAAQPMDLPPAFRRSGGAPELDDRWKAQVRLELQRSPDLAQDERWAAALASYIQLATQDLLLDLAQRSVGLAQSPNLCLAGGVALNATTNGRISRELVAGSLFVQPASSDAGLAIGAALAADHALHGEIRGRQPSSDSLGRRYTESEVEHAIAASPDTYELTRGHEALELAASRIAAGAVIGWFEGGSEFGPRALGHRSILADPRRPGMKDHLNLTVKKREGFRPFAASALSGHVSYWFRARPDDRFMVTTYALLPEKVDLVPAVAHVDGSTRLQVLHETDGPFGVLIGIFHRMTGVPMILNTSFNEAGNPIVETPSEALRAWSGMKLDGLWMDGRYLQMR